MESQLPFDIPCIIDGQEVRTGETLPQVLPHDHARVLANAHSATPELLAKAIESSVKAQKAWEDMPWADKAAIFLKAADLIAGKYRFELMAATMLGQGKNAWQAEIDAAAEMADFFRFGVSPHTSRVAGGNVMATTVLMREVFFRNFTGQVRRGALPDPAS